jgi:hypothetical protein
MQVAWANFTRANGCCKLHGQISRVQTAAASCMGKFHACKRLLQVAWTNFTRANGLRKLHGQIPKKNNALTSSEGITFFKYIAVLGIAGIFVGFK